MVIRTHGIVITTENRHLIHAFLELAIIDQPLPLHENNILVVKSVGQSVNYEEVTPDEMIIRGWEFGASEWTTEKLTFRTIRPTD